MKKSVRTVVVKFARTIPAAPGKVFDAWLDPKSPGTPWHESEKLILNPKVDGFFYWRFSGTPHYGRFTKLARPGKIEHTWMSPYTLGKESTVTVTFKKKGAGTLMTLVHSGLPDKAAGDAHTEGWEHFLRVFPDQFGTSKGKKK